MKRFLILICIAIFSACQPLAVNSPTSTPSEVTNSSSSSSTKDNIAQCPKADPNLAFDVEKAWQSTAPGEQNKHFTKYVLDFLNLGGTQQSILSAFEKLNGGEISTFFRVEDVNGDQTPEFVFTYGIWLDVFGCKEGKYDLTFSDTYESNLDSVSIIDITDINRDGLAEIIVNMNGCMGNRCPTIRVYEWNGKDFTNLIANPFNIEDGCSSLIVAPFEVNIRDIDNNGTKEIILINNGHTQPDNDFPYRKETRICMWNGQNIVVYKTEFDAPYYRFQAVQDGDRATISGDYGKALIYYQQTINDKNLEWFTQDRKWYDFWIYHSKVYSSEPTPTASPTLTQDPHEYPTLAAYAYYRIMLLYILENDVVNAKSTFNKTQNEFPPESPGNYFVKVASIFWQDYQSSTNIQNFCSKVVEYAQEHPLPIEYLGDRDHGVHSIEYTPEAICPFR